MLIPVLNLMLHVIQFFYKILSILLEIALTKNKL